MTQETATQTASNRSGLPPLLLIFLTVLIDMIGFGIVIPILPLYSEKFGATPWQTGLLLASFSAVQLWFAPYMGKLSDKYGRRPILLISVLGTAVAFAILGLANSLALLFVGRIIDGITGANIPTAQAYIADNTPVEKRSRAMGIFGAAIGLGFMLGPAIGGLMSKISIHAPFLAASALALINAVGIYFYLPESLPPEKRGHHLDRPSAWRTLVAAKDTPLATIMACSLTATIGFSCVTALFTLFTAKRFGWDAHDNGWMFTYIGFLGVLIQGGLLGRLILRFEEKPLIIAGTVCLLVSMAMLPVVPGFWGLIAAATLLSLGNSFVMPLLSGWASKTADPQSQGVVLGLMQSIGSLGRMIGPAMGGVLLNLDLHHPQRPYGISPFWASAALMVFAVTMALKLREAAHSVHLQESPLG